ncbi:MAG: hypothetical protein ACR2HZ_01735 [Gemmatimonadaceae bacterium]
MTVAEWVLDRAPDAPESLTGAVCVALGSDGELPATRAADVLMAAAERALARFVSGGVQARDGALPLLTIDALVTFALEAAAEHPDEIEDRARRAMIRLASLGGAPA